MVNLMRALRLTLVLAVILGLVYPLAVTGLGQWLFPYQAGGSMVRYDGRVVGSGLIAQGTTKPGLFWPRPSAVNYAGNGSGGSNLGPTNPALVKEVRANLNGAGLPAGTPPAAVPPSMVESSASGLDPDITVPDALLQIPRVAGATGLSTVALRALVGRETTGPIWGFWGVAMVNVLQLNLALERELGKR